MQRETAGNEARPGQWEAVNNIVWQRGRYTRTVLEQYETTSMGTYRDVSSATPLAGLSCRHVQGMSWLGMYVPSKTHRVTGPVKYSTVLVRVQ